MYIYTTKTLTHKRTRTQKDKNCPNINLAQIDCLIYSNPLL